MGLIFKRFFVFCLLAFFFFSEPATAPAFDKRESRTLSHYILAGVYDDLGDFDRAVLEYQKAIRIDKSNPALHLGLAATYIKKNDFPQAIKHLDLTAALDAELVEPHALLALLYYLENKADQANTEYEIALRNASKLEPQNIEIYKSLGTLYLRQKKFLAAESVYQFMLNLAPNDPTAHFLLGNTYNALNKNELAEKELKRAIELRPDYSEALNYLGYLYVEEDKNLDAAEGMIKRAIEIEPDNGAYIDSLGWLYFKQGKLPEAREELEKAAGLIEDPVVYDHLGDVYFKLGNAESAKINWGKSLKLDPNQEKVKEKLYGN